MVSTRSRSRLSNSSLHTEEHGGADTHDEVTSAAVQDGSQAATPRRSTRLTVRSSPGSGRQPQTARRQRGAQAQLLEAIAEEQTPGRPQRGAAQGASKGEEAEEQQQRQQQQQQQGEAAQEKRQGAAPAGAAEQQQQEEQQQAEASVDDEEVGEDVLEQMAREMFSALDGAFVAGGEDEEDSSSSEEEEQEEEQYQAQEQQRQQPLSLAEVEAAVRFARGEYQAAVPAGKEADAAAQQQKWQGEGDESSEEEDEEGEGAAAGAVPRHLRWEPELQLPGAEGTGADHASKQQRKQQQQSLAKQFTLPTMEQQRQRQRAARKAGPSTAGKEWFDLPATQITDEVKRDLRLLQLRGAFDPKSFYKRPDATAFPKHFVFGTVVEGAQDFYSGRLLKRERKRTFTEEVLADPQLAQVRKKRYTKMQDERAEQARKGKSGQRKTSNPRLKKKPHKPKH